MTHSSHLHVRSRTLPGPRRRWSTLLMKQCHLSSAEKDTQTRTRTQTQKKLWLGQGQRERVLSHSRISLHAQTSLACPSASIYHLESIIFHSVYHSSLYVLSTSADNCFPSPSALCLRLFIAPPLHRPQSMDALSPHRSAASPAPDLC